VNGSRLGLRMDRRAVVGLVTMLATIGAVLVLFTSGDSDGTARLVAAPVAAAPGPAELSLHGDPGASAAFGQEPGVPDHGGPATDNGGVPQSLVELLDHGTGQSAESPAPTSPEQHEATQPVAAAPPAFEVPELATLFELTNRERASFGAQFVVPDASLNRTAQQHADWMAAHGDLCHSSECDRAAQPDSSVWNGWAENVGASVHDSPEELQRAFVSSSSHLENMVDPRHHYVGMGWAKGFDVAKGTSVYYVVVQFGMNRV